MYFTQNEQEPMPIITQLDELLHITDIFFIIDNR